MLTLEILEGGSSGQVYKFEDYSVSVGRGDGNSLVLSDYHLSGDHLSIFLDGDAWVVRDLRSTNGTRCRREAQTIALDSTVNFETTLKTGDEVLLGDPDSPVVIRVALPTKPPSREEDLGDSLIASRSIIDLSVVKTRVERDPKWATRVYSSLQPLTTRLELGALLEAVTNSIFELLPNSTNVAVLLRSESDADRFTLALAREQQRTGDAGSTMLAMAKREENTGSATVRASRVLEHALCTVFDDARDAPR